MHELRELLLDNLEWAYGKRGWHGVTLRASLRGVHAEDAIWRPAPGRHNIWELTAHAAHWKSVARRRLHGGGKSVLTNWIAAPADANERAWRELIHLLDEEHRRLRETIESLSDDDLQPQKTRRLIVGVAAHDVYHTGQIQLVKTLRKKA